MILLDTHVLVWFANGEARLGRTTKRRVESALQKDEVCVSAITFWELASLLATKRLRGIRTADEFRQSVFQAGIVEVAVDGEIAILSTRLVGMHSDPADRFIVATALSRRAILVTADQKILRNEERADAPRRPNVRVVNARNTA